MMKIKAKEDLKNGIVVDNKSKKRKTLPTASSSSSSSPSSGRITSLDPKRARLLGSLDEGKLSVEILASKLSEAVDRYVLYCTVLYCTVIYCTVLYCTVLYCTVLYCTVLYCTVLYCTVL